MKKWVKMLLIVFVLSVLAVIVVFIPFFLTDDYAIAKRDLQSIADISSGTVEELYDDHGGFLGDGERFIKISFKDESCIKSIKENNDWNAFPLTDDLIKALYGKDYSLGDTEISEGPLIISEKIDIPEIKNGYYYFKDMYEGESLQPEKTAENIFNGAYSYNIVIVLYDTDNKILYYYRLDT